MLAKVIDVQSPFYGIICEVGELTDEGVYRISEKDAPWHSGYAHEGQLQMIENNTERRRESIDRYSATGTPYPDPETMCDDCEGMGCFPVFMSINLPPAKEGEARVADEENETYQALWLEAEAKEHADDGWQFIRCPTCKGTRLKPD